MSATLSVSRQFVLAGNVRDRFIADVGSGNQTSRSAWQNVVHLICDGLEGEGFEYWLIYERLAGLRLVASNPRALQAGIVAASEVLALDFEPQSERPSSVPVTSSVPMTLPRLCEVAETWIGSRDAEHRGGLLIDYASQLCRRSDELCEDEHVFFLSMLELSHRAPRVRVVAGRPMRYRPVVWVTDQAFDLPAWLISGNPWVRLVELPLPGMVERERLGRTILEQYFPGEFVALSDAAKSQLVRRLAGASQGMMLTSLFDIAELARDGSYSMDELEDAVRAYRVGVSENPWQRDHLRRHLQLADETLRSRVIGQDKAIRRVTEVLARSATGLTAAHAVESATRPRGVLFFGGPSGVGKTELAKAITELIFGDENAYTRFDMSEFRAEHTDARLVGSPPGYVGFEAGGELTNAVRSRPFSVLLFDEIEKAHPRVLDKFLQILEDGRLTDGRGETVLFSETLIIFTSNLGVVSAQEDRLTGRREVLVTVDDAYDHIDRTVRAETERFFTEVIGRPELLNRIGDNIVVFDFIRENAAKAILTGMVERVQRRVREEHNVTITFADGAEETLLSMCYTNPALGGRGIGNRLESVLTNPLAAFLLRNNPEPGAALRASVKRDARSVEFQPMLGT